MCVCAGALLSVCCVRSFSVGTCIVVSALRAVVYLITLHLKALDEEEKDVMSDHVFLGLETRAAATC